MNLFAFLIRRSRAPQKLDAWECSHVQTAPSGERVYKLASFGSVLVSEDVADDINRDIKTFVQTTPILLDATSVQATQSFVDHMMNGLASQPVRLLKSSDALQAKINKTIVAEQTRDTMSSVLRMLDL